MSTWDARAHDPGGWSRHDEGGFVRLTSQSYGHDHVRDESTEWYERRYNHIWYNLSPYVRAELNDQQYDHPQSNLERVDRNELQGIWYERSCKTSADKYAYERDTWFDWRQDSIEKPHERPRLFDHKVEGDRDRLDWYDQNLHLSGPNRSEPHHDRGNENYCSHINLHSGLSNWNDKPLKDTYDWYDHPHNRPHKQNQYCDDRADCYALSCDDGVGKNEHWYDGTQLAEQDSLSLLTGAAENFRRIMSQTMNKMNQKLDMIEKTLGARNANLCKAKEDLGTQQVHVDEPRNLLPISKKNEASLLVEEMTICENIDGKMNVVVSSIEKEDGNDNGKHDFSDGSSLLKPLLVEESCLEYTKGPDGASLAYVLKPKVELSGEHNRLILVPCGDHIFKVPMLTNEDGIYEWKDRAANHMDKSAVDHFSKGNVGEMCFHYVDKNKEEVMCCAPILATLFKQKQGKAGKEATNVFCLRINCQPYMIFQYPSMGWTSFHNFLLAKLVHTPTGSLGDDLPLLERLVCANKFYCETLKDAYEGKLASLVSLREDDAEIMEFAMVENAQVLATSYFEVILHELPDCLIVDPMLVLGVRGGFQDHIAMFFLVLKLPIPRRLQWDPGGACSLSKFDRVEFYWERRNDAFCSCEAQAKEPNSKKAHCFSMMKIA
ncbi:uncharacterized protein LOC120013714 [Tripterygium wilfordii]|uniref:uncharacterized protein LOC120013714 n=1 Tax=Tripterygium wilfordii TaxID=458696 RepID=UPI0018F82CA5|nr:uncharacterized protein LOC120013714 [Tripterygium wilfordii]